MSISNVDREALVALEQQALRMQLAGDFVGAARVWEKLLEQDPDWEHGIAHYSLAQCYAELGRFAEAEKLHLAALRMEPSFPHLGGYASFLYLHGTDARNAWNIHLQLVQLEAFEYPETAKGWPQVYIVGHRNGLPEAEITRQIEAAREAGRRRELPEIVREWKPPVIGS